MTGDQEYQRGLYGFVCWNGLSVGQQERLLVHGNLPIDYQPSGWCHNPAELEIETRYDAAPGPRFLCVDCLPRYAFQVMQLRDAHNPKGEDD